ncbi:MAG: hypothetical protein H7Y88_00030 [Phycisphaerales bacterium]|nr:hypothetical protein [Phycisphaerales bacterium]
MQQQLDCGDGAAVIILSLFGRTVPVEVSISEGSESSFDDLSRFFSAHGLFCEARKLTPGELIALRLPAVLQLDLRLSDRQQPLGHFAVFMSTNDESNGYYFDPISVKGRGLMPMRSITEKWTGHALVVSDHPFPSQHSRVSDGGWIAGSIAIGLITGITLGRVLEPRRV